MTIVVDGREIARKALEELEKEPVREKFLGIVIIREDSLSQGFLNRQIRTAKKLEVRTFNFYHLGDSLSGTERLAQQISELCEYEAVGGD